MDDVVGDDAFGAPQIEEAGAAGILADGGEVGDARALACGSDGGVAGVAAVAGAVIGLSGGLVEFEHGLAHADQVDHQMTTWPSSMSTSQTETSISTTKEESTQRRPM